MNRPKIAVEYPTKYLDRDTLTDINFVLYHLLNRPEYAEWAKKKGKMTILDNSAYELHMRGMEFNMEEFVKCINEINPDYFIIPDVLMDMDSTLENLLNFPAINTNSKAIAVLQGNSPEELLKCLGVYKQYNIDYVAIPFHNSFFRDMGFELGEKDTDRVYAAGRRKFLHDHKDKFEGLKVHLLGTHHPEEFKDLPRFVESIDTAYAVKKAIVLSDLLSPGKPDILIDDIRELSDSQLEKIHNNVEQFISLVSYENN